MRIRVPDYARLTTLSLLLCATVGVGSAPAFELFGFRLFGEDEDAEAELVLDPVDYAVSLTVLPGPGDTSELEETLRDASTLVSDEDEPVAGSLGLIAKARQDRKRLVAALFEEARYEGLVDIFIAGRNVADLPPDTKFDTSRPVPVAIRVRPGSVYQLGQIDIDVAGLMVDPAEYDLVPGGPAGSVEILDGESRLFTDLRDTGRPFVAVTDRDIFADAARNRVDYILDVSPGPTVPFGEIWVDGTEAVDPGFVAYMTGIQADEVFSPEDLRRARERLVELGVFSSVTVREARGQGPDGRLPVQVQVAERNFGFYGIGATYSNTEGAGASGYIGHRNLFGRAESLRLDLSVSRIGATAVSAQGRETDEPDFAGSLVFRKPGVLGPDSVYVGSITAGRQQPLPYDREFVAVDSGVEYRIDENQTADARIRGEYATLRDFTGSREYLMALVPVTYTFDNRDNELNPTEGFYFEGQATPAYDFEGENFFARGKADARTYLSFDDDARFVLAGRVALGAIVGADVEDIPNDKRFYAGGGGSVRGYEYLSIGPYFPSFAPPNSGFDPDFADTPIGGRSLFEANLEARIGITENIQIVPFLDFGAVGLDLTPDFSDLKMGAGLGARYVTGFGPIRVDVGVPLDPGPRDADFQIYAGIGQAF